MQLPHCLLPTALPLLRHDLADGKYDATHVKDLDPRLLPEFCLMTVVQSIRMPSTVLKELVSMPKLLDTSR